MASRLMKKNCRTQISLPREDHVIPLDFPQFERWKRKECRLLQSSPTLCERIVNEKNGSLHTPRLMFFISTGLPFRMVDI